MTAETSNARGESMIAGALFDFLGYLTTRDERAQFGAVCDASPAVELLSAWAKTRGLSLDEARVKEWRDDLVAPPPAAARGDVRGLVALAKRVQYADTHAQVSKDDAGEFVCLPPWLWLEIRDAAAEALAAEGVQAGEVEQRARELLIQQWDARSPAVAQEMRAGHLTMADRVAIRALTAALTGERNG